MKHNTIETFALKLRSQINSYHVRYMLSEETSKLLSLISKTVDAVLVGVDCVECKERLKSLNMYNVENYTKCEKHIRGIE